MRPLIIAIALAAVLIALLAVNTDKLDDKSQLIPAEGLKSPFKSNESGNLQTFLFIETRTDKNGTIINGTPGTLFIDAPTYDLRDSSLRTVEEVELNSSTKAVYGSHFQIFGDIGGGISSWLDPVIDLPYNHGEINILKIEKDNVTLNCYGEDVTLMPRTSWRREKTQPEEIGDRLLNVTTNVTVYNHGNVSVKVDR
ncbi:MAG TPA: hypothetical protein VN455_03050 [Methanotrichaceae archaeon]|nr:hypothetical protein [Methanotrichaceae archaeon]